MKLNESKTERKYILFGDQLCDRPWKCRGSNYLDRTQTKCPLRWRHNGRDSVSNHQPHGCFVNRLFRHRSKKTPKLRVTGLCAGNSPGTGEFPAQMASHAEKCFHLMTSSCDGRIWHSANWQLHRYVICRFLKHGNMIFTTATELNLQTRNGI